MSYFSGQHGRAFIKTQTDNGSPQPVGSLKNWSLNMQQAVIDCSTLAATDRALIPGIRSYTGSASMIYYQEANSNVKKMIENSFKASSKTNPNVVDFCTNTPAALAFLRLQLVEGSNTYDIDCNCYITSFSISCAVGEVVTAEISFEGVGLPTALQL